MNGDKMRYQTRPIATAFLFTLFATCGFGQSKPAQKAASPKDNGPSLEETNAWLKDKILNVGGFHRVSRAPGYNSIQENFFYKGATLNECDWQVAVHDELNGSLSDRTILLKLQELEPVVVVVTRNTNETRGWLQQQTFVSGDPMEFDVIVATEGNKQLITFHGIGNPSDGKQSRLGLAFTDKDIADRVAKAVSHAITLCKAKPEPF